MKPRVHVISLGGTIAMAGEGAAGVVPKLDAADLVAAVPEVEAVAAVTAESFRQVAGANLGFADIIALAGRIGDMAGQGIDGFVVTQGADTLEDSAFLLACLTDGSVPVAVTGAMRNPTQVGGDGPANLLAAVCVAASGETAEHGVVVVMNDEIHTARHVTKAHRFNVAAFASPDTGPIGWVAEGRVRYHGTAKPPPRFRPVELTRPAEVALLTSVFGSQGRLLDGFAEKGFDGLVVEAFGVEAVLATRSEAGMTLVTAAGLVEHLPAQAREVYDVSGAGDTVAAVVAAALAAGLDLARAARLANLAAGVVVGKVGTAVAWPGEVVDAIHALDQRLQSAKLAGLESVQRRIADWRREGLSIGFTNGCFDLIHPGHVSLLRQARAACDRLIVGLNSDDSVRRLKGADRPIQDQEARAAVLGSLADVDQVVIFEEDTPLALIEAIRPEVLVKGADYSLDQVVGGELVRSYGGQVVLARLEDGHSTTRTIEKLTG